MKLLLDEPETEATREMWHEATRISSTWLTVVETRSAVARARRMGRLKEAQAIAAITEAKQLLGEVDLMEVDPPVITSAAELADAHALRAYDAVQLASALTLGDAELVVATWDRELRRAVNAEGLTLVEWFTR